MTPDRNNPRDTHNAEAGESLGRVHFLPILALALLLRLLMALAMAKGDPNLWFYNQASELGCLAHSVNTGHGLASPFCGVTGPSAFLAPGYPLLVAGVFRLFGEFSREATTAFVGSQILFGLMIVLALMLFTRRVFGPQAANFAGTLCAISPTMVWLPVLFWETSLSLTGALALALHCVDEPKRFNWAAMGLLCALAMLVNPALMLTLVAILAWTAWQNSRARGTLAGPLLTVLVWAIVFAAWPIRNEVVLHSFIPLRSNLGYELWQGNHPGSNGGFSPDLHLNVNRAERTHYIQVGEVAYMREKSAIAMAAIKADPARFANLSLQRFARFWIGITPRKNSAIVIASLSFSTLLAIAGLVLLMRRQPAYAVLFALPFLLFPLPYYLTHADFRFRLLLDPIAIVLGTYAIQRLHRHISARRIRGVLAVTLTAA